MLPQQKRKLLNLGRDRCDGNLAEKRPVVLRDQELVGRGVCQISTEFKFLTMFFLPASYEYQFLKTNKNNPNPSQSTTHSLLSSSILA